MNLSKTIECYDCKGTATLDKKEKRQAFSDGSSLIKYKCKRCKASILAMSLPYGYYRW